MSRLLEYTPSARITPLQACAHTFFDELREPGTKLPNGREMPPLFNFTEAELKIQPTLNSQLIPSHMASGMISEKWPIIRHAFPSPYRILFDPFL